MNKFLARGFYEKGAMALSSIMVLAAILLALGLAMASSGFIQSNIVFNQGKSNSAFYLTEAGAKDAMQRVARNKNYSNAGYILNLTNGSANVVVCHNDDIITCSNIAVQQTEILSTGVSGTNTKKIRAVLDINAGNDGNGKITVVSWEEVGN